MCLPIVALGLTTGLQTAIAGLSIASAAASVFGQNKSAKAQAAAINQQNEVRAQEISVQKGKELTENAQRAIAERAAMRASAAEAGVNIQAGSFMSALQTSAITESNDNGTIYFNERVLQRARAAEANSTMSRVTKITPIGAALKIGSAAVGGYASATAKNPQKPST
jgi:hypothetical protein